MKEREPITIFNLKEHLKTHAQEMGAELEGMPQALYKQEKAKNNVERIEKRLDIQYRDLLKKKGEKYTEKRLDALVKTDPEYLKAVDDYLETCKDVNVFNWKKNVFMTEGFMMRYTAELFAVGYYAPDINLIDSHLEKKKNKAQEAMEKNYGGTKS